MSNKGIPPWERGTGFTALPSPGPHNVHTTHHIIHVFADEVHGQREGVAHDEEPGHPQTPSDTLRAGLSALCAPGAWRGGSSQLQI